MSVLETAFHGYKLYLKNDLIIINHHSSLFNLIMLVTMATPLSSQCAYKQYKVQRHT